MDSIPQYLTAKHRECDDYFTEAESAVATEDWALALQKFNVFKNELLIHLDAEEKILFPEFEQATGMVSGPTQVMRMEHEQMRALLHDLLASLTNKQKNDFLGYADTLMVLIQQHNMKEEMMLYPMAEQHIPSQASLLSTIKEHCSA